MNPSLREALLNPPELSEAEKGFLDQQWMEVLGLVDEREGLDLSAVLLALTALCVGRLETWYTDDVLVPAAPRNAILTSARALWESLGPEAQELFSNLIERQVEGHHLPLYEAIRSSIELAYWSQFVDPSVDMTRVASSTLLSNPTKEA